MNLTYTRRVIALLVVFLGEGLLSEASAQPILSADLDTKEGHFSSWAAGSLSGITGCSFRAELVKTYRDGKWAPVVAIALKGPAEGERQMLRLLRPDRNKPFVGRLVVVTKGQAQEAELSQSIEEGVPINIRLA